MQKLYSCNLGTRNSDVYTVVSLDTLDARYEERNPAILWVADRNTQHLVPKGAVSVVLEAGESEKGWSSIERIVRAAQRHAIARDGRLIALGGGVVCDMTAFAASIYMRGCALTLIPTTLLAMVDASLGGKTAIDLLGMKNLVGTFYPADEIMIYPDALQTLHAHEFTNGLGEVLKHAILAPDTTLTQMLSERRELVIGREQRALEQIIALSLDVKRSYIERDPTEKLGIRDALNLGHTFAHALESVGNMSTWSHGEAVAWGVIRALDAGVAMGITDASFAETYRRLFVEYGFDTTVRLSDIELFLEALASDKKRRQGHVRFVLMEGQGRYRLQRLEESLIRQVIA